MLKEAPGGGTRRSSQVALPPPCSAACSGATSVIARYTVYVPPALRGRGHRSAMSLPGAAPISSQNASIWQATCSQKIR